MRERVARRRPAPTDPVPAGPRRPIDDVRQLGRWIGNRALTGMIARVPTRPVVAAHGKNPGDAIRALNAKLRKPASAKDAEKVAAEWLAGVRKILNAADAGTTGASHAADIVQNELAELAQDEASLKTAFADLAKEKASVATYKDAIDSVTARRLAEIALEFRHNIVLTAGTAHTVTKQGADEVATDAGPMEWQRAELTQLDEALQGVPADAAWANPRTVTFKRTDFDVAGGHPNRRIGGITAGSTPDVTMTDTGMQRTDWGRIEDPNVRNPAYVHAPRHELGHVVYQRLTHAETEELYTTIMGWEQYPLAFLNDEAHDPTTPKRRTALRQETGLGDAELGRFLTSVQAPDASHFHGPRTTRGRRTYFKSAGFLHSVGSPAELPTGPEFDYCYDNQGEYIADLFAFAIARPAWLASKLSQRQIKWWKEVVFRVPVDANELKRQLNPPAAVEAQLLSDAATLFTWEQIDQRLAELVKAQRAAPARPPARVP